MFLPIGIDTREGIEYRINPTKQIKNFLENHEIGKNVHINYEVDFGAELGYIVLTK